MKVGRGVDVDVGVSAGMGITLKVGVARARVGVGDGVGAKVDVADDDGIIDCVVTVRAGVPAGLSFSVGARVAVGDAEAQATRKINSRTSATNFLLPNTGAVHM